MSRSFLFVPGDSRQKFDRAGTTAADALILDLEIDLTFAWLSGF